MSRQPAATGHYGAAGEDRVMEPLGRPRRPDEPATVIVGPPGVGRFGTIPNQGFMGHDRGTPWISIPDDQGSCIEPPSRRSTQLIRRHQWPFSAPPPT